MVNKLSQAAIHWLAQFRSIFHLIPAHELAHMTCCQEDGVRWNFCNDNQFNIDIGDVMMTLILQQLMKVIRLAMMPLLLLM